MAHIILTGATGHVGSAVLAYALSSSSVAKISIISRRPVALASNNPKKVTVHLHSDFLQYPDSLLNELRGASACIWAQGISSRGMSEKEYEEITVRYPVAAARAFAGISKEEGKGGEAGKMVFVYISGEGASIPESKASMMFGRIKGRAERSLLDLQASYPGLWVYNLRPGIINPEGNYLAERKVTLQDRLSTWTGVVAEQWAKGFVIPARELGRACVELALGDGVAVTAGKGVEEGGRVLRNVGIRGLVGL